MEIWHVVKGTLDLFSIVGPQLVVTFSYKSSFRGQESQLEVDFSCTPLLMSCGYNYVYIMRKAVKVWVI